MPETKSGFPYFEVQFDKDGNVHDAAEVQAVLDFVAGDTTDLFVLSHGWNNDMDEARNLYQRLLARFRAELDAGRVPGVAGRKLAVLGVLWPSKKFAEKDLIASGAASAGGVVSNQDLQEEIDALAKVIGDPAGEAALARARELVPRLENSPAAQREFVEKLREVLGGGIEDQDEEAPPAVLDLPGDQVFERLSKPLPKAASGGQGGAAGGATGSAAGGVGGGVGGHAADASGSAAGLGVLSGIKGAGMKLLNLTTYYKMKDRAGVVGRDGLNPLLRQLRAKKSALKLHLVGHSFGGRLVTAAALGKDGQEPVKPDTLTLLQAAFSHYGFSGDYEDGKPGFFRRVVGQVGGPILISHTRNDKAVGVAYPLASQLARQAASALGDKDSRWGGIGANGAQKTSEVVQGQLLAVGGAYQLAKGKVYNLNADTFIKGHSDIDKAEVAHAVLTAVAGT
jgi:hypothetical protein